VGVTVIDLPQRGRPARTSFKVELYDSGNFAAAGWPSLADSGDLKMRDLKMYVFQSREFLQIWLNTIGKAGRVEPHLVVVKDGNGRPILYLPLVIETKFNIRLLRFMDCGVADYNAPVVAAGIALSRQEFNALWSEVLALLPGFDVIDLKKMAGDISGTVNPLTYLDCAPFSDSGHSIALTGPEKARPSPSLIRLRRRLKRAHQELSKIGELEYVVNPAPARAQAVMQKLFELKRRKYAQTDVPDFLDAPGVADFYGEALSPRWIGKLGHLSALTIGGTVIAAHLGFVGRDRFYYIFPAHDADYGRYRPGYLLLEHLIDQSIKEGRDIFDLGVGDAPYKMTWETHNLRLYSHVRAMSAAGRVYLQMRRVRRFIKAGGVRTWFRPAG
jgi:CelD/BcsL family acetyltransferase involved in cellulose biosynthesis